MNTQIQSQSELPKMHGGFNEIPLGISVFAVMGLDGDTKYMWDKSKPVEVDMARKMFDEFVKEKKYVAFKVDKDGKQGEGPIKEFDPNEERYIFSPQLQGG